MQADRYASRRDSRAAHVPLGSNAPISWLPQSTSNPAHTSSGLDSAARSPLQQTSWQPSSRPLPQPNAPFTSPAPSVNLSERYAAPSSVAPAASTDYRNLHTEVKEKPTPYQTPVTKRPDPYLATAAAANYASPPNTRPLPVQQSSGPARIDNQQRSAASQQLAAEIQQRLAARSQRSNAPAPAPAAAAAAGAHSSPNSRYQDRTITDEDTRVFTNPVQEARAQLYRPGSIRSDYTVVPTQPPPPYRLSAPERQWSRTYGGRSRTSCYCRVVSCALTIVLLVSLSLGVYYGVSILKGTKRPKGIDNNRQVDSNTGDNGPAICKDKGPLSNFASYEDSSKRDVEPRVPFTTSTLHIKFKTKADPILTQLVDSAKADFGPNFDRTHLTPQQIFSFLSEKMKDGWVQPEYKDWLSGLSTALSSSNIDVVQHINRFYYGAYGRIVIVEFENITPDQFQTVQTLLSVQLDLVEWVIPDRRVSLAATLTKVDDPQVSGQWGLNSLGVISKGALGSPPAWTVTTGSKKVVVAVMDTGIDTTHPDLVDNLWVNPAEKAGAPGVDDDKNGKVDDIHGWNFVDSTGDLSDPEGHGTHVAGILGAIANNGLYGAGVSPVVSIMVLKVLNRMGDGLTSVLVQAMDYALAKGAHISSHSLGTVGEDLSLQAMIDEANNQGHLVVAAAGNDRNNNDVRPTYPATYNVPNVISVGWMDRYGCFDPGANYGRSTVHLVAPGSAILSTYPLYLSSPSGIPGMAIISGSSQATPHVSGVAALIMASWEQQGKDFRRRALSVKQIIIDSVEKDPVLQNYTISGGRLNAARALALAANTTLGPPISAARLITSVASPLLWLTSLASLWMTGAVLKL